MHNLTYILPDKLGGIMSLNSSIIQYKPQNNFTQTAILLHYAHSKDTRYAQQLMNLDRQYSFEYSKFDNIYHVFKKFKKLITDPDGVIISNDMFELLMIRTLGIDQTVFQLVHDDYNFGLSLEHESIIDVFIAHSLYIFEKLKQSLPHRKDNIFYLPYGVNITNYAVNTKTNKLRLIFIGRINAGKGVFDLPVIDNYLEQKGLFVEWVIIGGGPDLNKLKEVWNKNNIIYCQPETNDEVLRLAATGQIFVLPTRFEGFPVSLLEAMSVGLVPVLTDLPGGIQQIVKSENGFKIDVEDTTEFAEKILWLYKNPAVLDSMSKENQRLVRENFDVSKNIKKYHELFSQYHQFKRHFDKNNIKRFGSRLDKPYFPNAIVRLIRKKIYKQYFN